MSTENIRKIEYERGVTVIDEETGISVDGETYTEALEGLVDHLRATQRLAAQLEEIDEIIETAEELQEIADTAGDLHDAAKLVEDLQQMENTSRFIRMAADVRKRFADEDIGEETVDDAIEWTRSQ